MASCRCHPTGKRKRYMCVKLFLRTMRNIVRIFLYIVGSITSVKGLPLSKTFYIWNFSLELSHSGYSHHIRGIPVRSFFFRKAQNFETPYFTKKFQTPYFLHINLTPLISLKNFSGAIMVAHSDWPFVISLPWGRSVWVLVLFGREFPSVGFQN